MGGCVGGYAGSDAAAWVGLVSHRQQAMRIAISTLFSLWSVRQLFFWRTSIPYRCFKESHQRCDSLRGVAARHRPSSGRHDRSAWTKLQGKSTTYGVALVKRIIGGAEASASAQVQFLTVGEESAGQRLDNFLIRHLKGVPKTHVYRIIRSGEVRVNKGRAAADTRVQDGDVVRLPPVRVSAQV